MTMTSSRPYIIRALYDWILENQCTPYVLVDAFGKGVEVPQEHGIFLTGKMREIQFYVCTEVTLTNLM